MKIKTESTPLEMGGVQVEGEFRIRPSAKAFSILSSGLYSNKIEAILRELGCNAYDSHVEAGKADVPFTVHLPNNLNPQFYVRDYGIGLDHEGVTQLYTTYFESTKQDSNDYVGCLGLGSKSPFSYTRNFTVTAIKNGVERIYNCFMNEQGIPSVALLNQRPTDAGNGVEVRFAVNNRNDMAEFENTAKKVYKWFKVKPEITGNAVNIPEVKYRERDIAPGIHLIENDGSGYYHRTQCYAQMGNVVYPIRLPDTENVPETVKTILRNGSYMFEFAIGELDVAASREELSYDPATIEAIVNKTKELLKTAGAYLLNETEKCKTDWERAKRLVELVTKDFNLFKPALQSLRPNLSPTLRGLLACDRFNGIRDLYFEVPSGLTDETVTVSHVFADVSYGGDQVALRTVSPQVDYTTNKVTHLLEQNTIFVVQNDKGNLLGRLRQYVKDGSVEDGQRFIVVRRARKNGDPEKVWKKISKLLGNPPVFYSDELPEVQNTVNTKAGEIKAYRFEFDYKGSWASDKVWKILPGPKKASEFKKIDGRIVYLPLHGKQVKKPDGQVVPVREIMSKMVDEDRGIFTILNKGRKEKISPECIYGVNGASLKTATESKDWVSLFDVVEEMVTKMDWQSLEHDLELAAKRSALEGNASEFYLRSDVAALYFKNSAYKDSPYGKMVKFFKETPGRGSANAQIHALNRLEEFLPKASDKTKKVIENVKKAEAEMGELMDEVRKRYPMMVYADSYGMDREKVEAILGYLEMVDKIHN